MAETTEAVKEKQDQQNGSAPEDSKTQAQSVEFSEAAATENEDGGGSIEILLDMSVLITVAIGKTQIPVRRLLQLGPGSVLKLDKPINAPADLYLKNTKFATGNVVVVDGQFAIRIKEIIGLGDSAVKAAEN
ncbi:MAG: FliM/FliN family flagellar motor switch protein [Planctomycetota bacterium]|jgi:flagellar motor switch protein FliN/FliY